MGVRLLSKSTYQRGRKCLRRIWLYNYRRELASPPSPVQEAIFEQGHEVGRLAQLLFPGGVLIAEDHRNPEGAIASTKKAIDSGALAIFEAAFVYDGILVRADILSRMEDGSWALFEVKSTTSVKKDHVPDIAIQTFVLNNTGLDLRSSHLIHLNRDYVKNGEVDFKQLFTLTDMGEMIADAYNEIPVYLKQIRQALASGEVPEVPIGSVCRSPYVCEFKAHCWTDVKDDSIHFLYRINDKKRTELITRAIERVKDIPDDIALTELQFIQVKSERSGAPNIEKEKISAHLDKLKYPLWFLDFETIGWAIPRYDGTWCYQALPFQFSLHALRKPDGELEHECFLHDEDSDPRRALAEALCKAIGETGSVVAYHAGFEGGRIKELIEDYPDLAKKLTSICERLWDLEIPFAKKWYYDPRFQGSSSIKKVLPALVPQLSYKGMFISKGDEAQLKYAEMISLPKGDAERAKIREALLEYCKLDTLAMVEILKVLQRL